MRTVIIRKINTTLGLLVPAVSIVLAGYMGCQAKLAIAMFILSVGFNTFTVPGCKCSMYDFAPAYAGVIFGFSNTWANFTGFLAPQTTGYLLEANSSLEGWQLAFWVSALCYMPGLIMFLIWGTDEVKEWAKEEVVENKRNMEKNNEDTTTDAFLS